MPFQVSPGVNVSEIDLTTVVPAVSTTEGALAGVFRWGPVGERVLVDSEQNLVNRFGKPTNHNAETFFTAANFLSYGNKLYVVRTANTTAASNNTTVSAVENGANLTLAATATSLGIAAGDTLIHAGVSYVIATADGTANVVLTGVSNTDAIFNTSEGIVFQTAAGAYTAIANTGAATSLATFTAKNEDEFNTRLDAGTFASADTDVLYIAKYPGALGNSLKVSVCDSANAYKSTANLDNGDAYLSSNVSVTNTAITIGSKSFVVSVAFTGSGTLANAHTQATALKATITAGDVIEVGNTSIGKQYLKVASVGAISNVTTYSTFTVTTEDAYALSTNFTGNASTGITRYWEYFNSVDVAPGTSAYQTSFGNASAVDELHVVVADQDGAFTGVPGTVLEVFKGLSRATDAKSEDGATNYYRTVINNGSSYIYNVNHRANADANTATNLTNSTNVAPLTLPFGLGADGSTESALSLGTVIAGYDLFASAESVDISLVLTGKSRGGTNGEQLANYLIDNIAESRKDCVVFASPDKDDVVNNAGDESTDVVTFRNSLRSTSYAVLDSGYKYQYDKYNDIYRFIPLNGDTAGLCVRTDDVRDPWFSPAGFNRGQIKNIVKLAYNPGKAERDVLYKAGVNPVVTFPGQGTVLFGDKTLLAKPSAFDRINVRRLFIVLEKAIATATKFTLFEFNDDFTRAQFRNLVEPFLRDVQGRRGIYDFKVVCDTTNNTGEVIDRNEFIGDIYIKPAKSINFIQLNFVAVRTGVEFSEVVGQF